MAELQNHGNTDGTTDICDYVNSILDVVVVVVRAAPDIPEMSVPGVGYSFKPKGLAFVTPLYPVSQTD